MLCAGQVYHTSVTVQNLDAQPVAVALSITKPDGTFVTPAPTPTGWVAVGRDYSCSYDYTLPTPGLFKFAWTTQAPGTAPVPEYVNVRNFIAIMSMAEAKLHLNKTTTVNDDELAGFLMAATELVENKIGICVPRSFTDQVDQGRYELVMPHKPILSVQSVTSIWPGGPAWDGTTLRTDADAGLVYQVPPFNFWYGPWLVTYTCGRPVMEERWIHAAKEQLRHLWETQRGSQPPALLQGEEVFTATTGFTFSVPRRVLELLEQDMVPSS